MQPATPSPQVAFRERLVNKFALQKIVYYSIRERFGLSSQMTIRAIAKVVGVDPGP